MVRFGGSATVFALTAAALTFFGLIHGSQVGVAVNLDIVIGYVLMAGIMGFLAIRAPAENRATTAVPARVEVATP